MIKLYFTDKPKLMPFPMTLCSWAGVVFCILGFLFTGIGCGTTKWSDTGRTATEQLLLTDAMDRAVGQIDFTALYGKTVSIDSKAIDSATDSKYFVSAVRQHLLANGARVTAKEDDADYIVELRTGAVGTDRNDLMVGIPAVTIPTGWASESFLGSTALPEIAVYKSTEQRAVVKVAVFAYNRRNNSPLWQSGNIQTESRIRARWLFGAGPFSKGDICNGTELAGTSLNPTITQIIDLDTNRSADKYPAPAVTLEAFYVEHENNIPTPTLNTPISESKPDSPENTDGAEIPEQLLADKSPKAEAESESHNQLPATASLAAASNVTPAGGNAAENASRDAAILLASANTNPVAPKMVLPPTYQPMQTPPQGSLPQGTFENQAFVPNASTLPWQNATSLNGNGHLAPGFTGF